MNTSNGKRLWLSPLFPEVSSASPTKVSTSRGRGTPIVAVVVVVSIAAISATDAAQLSPDAAEPVFSPPRGNTDILAFSRADLLPVGKGYESQHTSRDHPLHQHSSSLCTRVAISFPVGAPTSAHPESLGRLRGCGHVSMTRREQHTRSARWHHQCRATQRKKSKIERHGGTQSKQAHDKRHVADDLSLSLSLSLSSYRTQ
ncbi:hypothetical protein T484DRAFT_2098921 [Baffinella frigidus]|nr:hypothetical protein T484DRAFT_2098921 [Cryptophyta sp. CCMP2293]